MGCPTPTASNTRHSGNTLNPTQLSETQELIVVDCDGFRVVRVKHQAGKSITDECFCYDGMQLVGEIDCFVGAYVHLLPLLHT